MFKLTAQTDPATVMFEGCPDVKIVGFSDKSPPEGGGVAVYIERNHDFDHRWHSGTMHTTLKGLNQTKYSNARYLEDGTLAECRYDTMPNWPRIVPRIVLDVTKPIVAKHCDHRWTHVGTFTPTDGSEPILHLRNDHTGTIFHVLASTGRTPPGEWLGSAGQWGNGPEVVRTGQVFNWEGHVISVNLTITDGLLTGVEWVN